MNLRLPFLISIAANGLLLALLFLLKNCNGNCPDAVITKITYDTIRVNEQTVIADTLHNVPVPKRITKAPSTFSPHSVSKPDSVAFCDTVFLSENICSDIVEYEDTIYKKDEYRAVFHEIVSNNAITNRRVLFYNLTPTVVEHIDKIIPQRERVKVFAGAFAGLQINYSNRKVTNWSVGPSVMLTIPQGVALSYGFDAKNNGHLFNLLYKIRIKK